MIGFLKGELLSVDEQIATLLCNNIGYEVFISPKLQNTLMVSQNKSHALYIYTHVREDQLNLFGFEHLHEKKLFLKLLSVSGVGAKTALVMLATLSYSALITAIVEKDIITISSCPGIGKKSAQRIAIELSDKMHLLPQVEGMSGASRSEKTSTDQEEVISALTNLGYRRETIMDALAQIPKAESIHFERTFKECLKILAT